MSNMFSCPITVSSSMATLNQHLIHNESHCTIQHTTCFIHKIYNKASPWYDMCQYEGTKQTILNPMDIIHYNINNFTW